ncbi:hypothetical protein LUZ62_030454 [Rhynchospora pubera]|uniref:Uncharacterized protein n=1 Tax=Rhynchospora pubera TaxID=906938 RepID=A0AAV8HJ22_9POAL|nr:hypothetical protein LUZ62_030454 [Rhynchospora pubera]
MVAVFNKELLSWYLITLKLRETVDLNISKSGPSTPSNPPTTPIPTLPIPYSQPQILRLTNGESHHDREIIPDSDPNPNLNQEQKEETLALLEHAPPQINTGIRTVQSLPTIPRSPCDTWVIYIREKLKEAKDEEDRNPWSKLSIYRVPKSLREGDEKSYVPQVVSIGPYHHGKKKLREMEPHKWRAVHRVLERHQHDIHRYIDAIQPLEERVRSCYEGRIAMRSNDFLLSLVLDGIFILELFIGATSRNGFVELGYSLHDPVFAMRGVMHTVQRDMIMLENQIPLFVLDRLLATQLGRPDQPTRIAELVFCFFDPLMPTDEPLQQRDRDRMETSVNGTFDPLCDVGLHCLDAFRRSLLRTSPKPQPPPRSIWRKWSATRRVADKRRQQFIHCVSELREAGIRCRKRKTDRFWDIQFDNNGTLQIPRILIHDGTKSLFLNLIAFEQCHLDTSSNTITSYVIFMDNLINTEEDVRYLHDRGIIEHWLGNDKEVADLFSRLCQEVVFDFNNSYLSGLSDSVNKYYSSRWNTWSASLKHNYFSNPWAIISFVAAVVLLLLTFAQTFYNVYAYYRPP